MPMDATLYFFCYLLPIAVCVVMLLSLWRVYTKCGRPGWEALVPFYGQIRLAIAVREVPAGITATIMSAVYLYFLYANMLTFCAFAAVPAIIAMYFVNLGVVKTVGFPDYVALILLFTPYFGYPLVAFINPRKEVSGE